jgi:hypothetical protein
MNRTKEATAFIRQITDERIYPDGLAFAPGDLRELETAIVTAGLAQGYLVTLRRCQRGGEDTWECRRLMRRAA